jgi:glutamate-ammonia-ligase adenylyltransferase
VLRFLHSGFSTSERYAAILRHAEPIIRSLELFDLSEYLTEILVRHPEEVATLGETTTTRPAWNAENLFTLAGEDNFAGRDPVFSYVANSTAARGEKAAMLRRHFRHRMFESGVRDVAELRPIYSSLAETSSAGEEAISAAFGVAGSPSGLAILALGRLGSREFDLLSDADLLFVGNERHDRAALTKAAEQVMQELSAYTQEGLVFPVDTRLRPRGGEGELVVTPAQLEDYFANEAQPWEALMYTKLRLLVGDGELGRRSMKAAEVLFQRFSEDDRFAAAVREMRRKLEAASAPDKSIRTSAGALYDADFLSSFLLVRHQIRPRSGTLRHRLWRCAAAGVLDKQDAAALDHAAELCRTVEHVLRLVTGRNMRWLPAAEHPHGAAERLSSGILRRSFSSGLETELLKTFSVVRAIYDRVLA